MTAFVHMDDGHLSWAALQGHNNLFKGRFGRLECLTDALRALSSYSWFQHLRVPACRVACISNENS